MQMGFDMEQFDSYRENNRLEVKKAKGGLPDIYAVWESQGFKEPIVEEQYHPDRTILTLPFVKKQAEKTSGELPSFYL